MTREKVGDRQRHSFEQIPPPLARARQPLPLPPTASVNLFRRPGAREEEEEEEAGAPPAPRKPPASMRTAAFAVALLLLGAAALGVTRFEDVLGSTTKVGHLEIRGGSEAHGGAASDPAAPSGITRSIGQHIMIGWRGTDTPPQWLLNDVRLGQVGGVVLFGENAPSPTVGGFAKTTDSLQAAATAGGQPPILIALDQEGGEVRRIEAPPLLDATKMGSSWSSVFRQARAAGNALRAAGVGVDLAPVADLATGQNTWESPRTFGGDPVEVAVAVSAFVAGLHTAGVASVVKHYPGLGNAEASTDAAAVTVTANATELAVGELPFGIGVAAGTELVMLSSAVYPALDKANPAVMSVAVIDGLRRWGFRGVTMSDDLRSPALGAYKAPAVRAIAAGCDVLLSIGRPASLISELQAALGDGRIDRRAWRASTRRILRLKKRLLESEREGR
jgi:beta-N-acetylhexosaminidase